MSLVVNSGDRSTFVVSHGGSLGEPGSRDGCGSRGGQDYRGGGRESCKCTHGGCNNHTMDYC